MRDFTNERLRQLAIPRPGGVPGFVGTSGVEGAVTLTVKHRGADSEAEIELERLMVASFNACRDALALLDSVRPQNALEGEVACILRRAVEQPPAHDLLKAYGEAYHRLMRAQENLRRANEAYETFAPEYLEANAQRLAAEEALERALLAVRGAL